jgi:hypothetical protein
VLNLTTSPPIAVLILLATTTINGGVIRSGIVGDGDSKPYDVLVLFISLVSQASSSIYTARDSMQEPGSLQMINITTCQSPVLFFRLTSRLHSIQQAR